MNPKSAMLLKAIDGAPLDALPVVIIHSKDGSVGMLGIQSVEIRDGKFIEIHVHAENGTIDAAQAEAERKHWEMIKPLIKASFIDAFGANGSAKREEVVKEVASGIGKVLKQRLVRCQGTVYLETLGKRVRALTGPEVIEAMNDKRVIVDV